MQRQTPKSNETETAERALTYVRYCDGTPVQA